MFQSNTRFFFKSHLQGKLFFCPSQPLLQEILGLGGKPLTVRYYWEWGEKSMNPIQNWREEPWDWFSVYLLRGQCKSSEITSERPSPDKLSPACYSAGETWAQSGKEAAQILQQQLCPFMCPGERSHGRLITRDWCEFFEEMTDKFFG